ncbi:hypothetical protein BC826DRAFT_1113744 [Russula brevipes]|nr:hypothetical protein BC826DRAFT_1113744 [Russula brevipes]
MAAMIARTIRPMEVKTALAATIARTIPTGIHTAHRDRTQNITGVAQISPPRKSALKPHSLKRTRNKGAIKRGPPREAFFHTTAALLCVPERYTRFITELSFEVAPNRSFLRYNEATFGSLDTVTPESVARYFSSIGVRTGEAERWRAWATAYVEMELEQRPNGTHAEELRQAREKARARIDDDPRWVLRKVHTDSPGNYNPAVERSCAAHREQADQPPSNTPEAGPSSAAQLQHVDDLDDADIKLEGIDDALEDDDERMGPA